MTSTDEMQMLLWREHIVSLPTIMPCPGCGAAMDRSGVKPELPTENREPFWCTNCGGKCKRVSSPTAESRRTAARHLVRAVREITTAEAQPGLTWDDLAKLGAARTLIARAADQCMHPDRVIARDRDPEDSCERGTPGCCVNHRTDLGGCETW